MPTGCPQLFLFRSLVLPAPRWTLKTTGAGLPPGPGANQCTHTHTNAACLRCCLPAPRVSCNCLWCGGLVRRDCACACCMMQHDAACCPACAQAALWVPPRASPTWWSWALWAGPSPPRCALHALPAHLQQLATAGHCCARLHMGGLVLAAALRACEAPSLQQEVPNAAPCLLTWK